jgi:hypothetical protein
VADDRANAPLSTQVFHILLSLVDDDLHGYAIIQDVAERTEGEVRLTASTLYAASSGCSRPDGSRSAGSVHASMMTPDAATTISQALGRHAARAEALRLERLAAMARDKRLIPAARVAKPASS